jgi:hypothetical protein
MGILTAPTSQSKHLSRDTGASLRCFIPKTRRAAPWTLAIARYTRGVRRPYATVRIHAL